ncbi:MAG: nitrite reductase small subunit NirD [Rhodocyclales bacterium]|nr:nitrite reductase small subunit NirD [Rhodocyclales bacterium]
MTEWNDLCALADIPRQGSRTVETAQGRLAVFRTATDRVFALNDRCPHKGGPLSQGIVTGERVVCPMHSWLIDLEKGEAVAPDSGCVKRHEARVADGRVLLRLG